MTHSVSAKEMLRIAIIGGGAGAREFVIRFLDLGAHAIPVSITAFEPRATFGRGIAWSQEQAPVLANMRVETLGPSYHQYDLIEQLLRDIGHPEATQEYPTRNAMGMALDERWRRKAETLPEHWRYEHVRKEVVDIEWDGKTATVTTDDDEFYRAYDLVILALGNLKPKPSKVFGDGLRYVNGWDVEKIRSIPSDCDVIIKGSSLTAIDATMRLLDCGHRADNRSIVWQSRSGTLPFVRPRQLKLDPDFITMDALEAFTKRLARRNARLTLEALRQLFEHELRSQSKKQEGRFAAGTDYEGFMTMRDRFRDPAKGREFIEFGIKGADTYCLWYSVAKLFDEYVIPFVWNSLADEEKAEFLEGWRRDFDRYWAPIPLTNGKRIRQWLNDGTIQLVSTGISHKVDPITGKILFDPTLEDPLAELSKADLRERYVDGFDFLIEAGGIPSDMEKLESRLVANLVAAGVLIPNKLRQTNGFRFTGLGAKIDWFTGAVLAADERPHGWLYTLTGSLTAGAHRFTNSYLAASISAQRVAADLIARNILTGPMCK